jgi:hypothetical protein
VGLLLGDIAIQAKISPQFIDEFINRELYSFVPVYVAKLLPGKKTPTRGAHAMFCKHRNAMDV